MIMATTRRISERAAPGANPRNSRSPQPRLARAETTVEERDRLAAAVVILLACRQERLALVGDLPEPRLDLLHDLGRQWRVEEIRRVLLAVVDHPPEELHQQLALRLVGLVDRKSTRLNSSHGYISYAVFCLKKKKKITTQ